MGNRGLSFIELIISVAILAIGALLILPGMSQQLKTLKSISRGGLCEAYVQQALGLVDTQRILATEDRPFLKPKIVVSSNLPGSSLVFEIPTELQTRFSRLGVASLYEQNGAITLGADVFAHNGVVLYSPLLANNSMGYLGDLYNDGFKDSFRPLPSELKPPESPAEKFEGEIKIALYKLEDGSEVSPISSRFWPRPKGQYERSTINHPNVEGSLLIAEFPAFIRDDLGFRVTVKGRVVGASGSTLGECSSGRDFSYGFDFHAVLDFVSDFNLVKYNGVTASALRDDTRRLSNKDVASGVMDPDLKPIFTNVALDPVNDGRERPLCSQKGQPGDFYLRLRVENMNKEPGIIPMCIDSSTQWLRGEVGPGGWCPATNVTGKSDVRINYDWKPLTRGWVPCERLTFCNQAPDRVETVESANAIEYRYHYSFVADNNASNQNRLWGCELKFLVAGVDTAGNLIYPPAGKPNTAGVTDPKPVVDMIREVNPKIYFKPPPCYTCECKPCKKGKGGFLGGFFKWIVFAVLVVVTGGSFLLAMPALTTFVAATLAGLCLMGGLGCETGGSGGSVPNVSGGGSYRACADVNNGCKCGQRCTKRRVPAPKWVDSVDPSLSPEDLEAKLLEKSCKPELAYRIDSGSVSFYPDLAYKTEDPVTHALVVDNTSPVLHRDEVIWQEFMPSVGKFCVAHYVCDDKVWKPVVEQYEDSVTGAVTSGPMVGCFDVKVGHKVGWNNPVTTLTTMDGTVTKPARGTPECLEVNFNKAPFTDTSSKLTSYGDLDAECGDTSGTGATPPVFSSVPTERLIGKMDYSCATPLTVSMGSTTRTVNLAAKYPLYTTDSDGATYFQCWASCRPPSYMPEGPLNGTEQRYYEPYNTTYSTLPFCTFDRSTFNRQ